MVKKKILVTGGAGYIGSHLLSELVLTEFEILILDNFTSGHQEAVDRVAKRYGKNIHCVELDLCQGPKLIEVVKRFKPDAVIHLAGLKSVNDSISMPVSYYFNNVFGTLNLLVAMDLAGCKQIIFSSSATVYGSPNSLPIDENHTFNPINPYGKSKLMVEEILKDWVVVDDARSAIALRYFNPIGAHGDSIIGEDPRVTPTNLMPLLLNAALGKSTLSIFGTDYETQDGTCERDFIHVCDLAKAHVKSLIYAETAKGFSSFNIGTGKSTSVRRLISIFEEVCNVTVPVTFEDRRAGDVPVCYAATSRANSDLRWVAELDISDMCRDSWAWRLANPDGYTSRR